MIAILPHEQYKQHTSGGRRSSAAPSGLAKPRLGAGLQHRLLRSRSRSRLRAAPPGARDWRARSARGRMPRHPVARTFAPSPHPSRDRRATLRNGSRSFTQCAETLAPESAPFAPAAEALRLRPVTFTPRLKPLRSRRTPAAPTPETFDPRAAPSAPRAETFPARSTSFTPRVETFAPRRATFPSEAESFAPGGE